MQLQVNCRENLEKEGVGTAFIASVKARITLGAIPAEVGHVL